MAPVLKRPDLTSHAAAYRGAFSVLTSDLKKLCEYVEPTDDNRPVYSHRTYELLLRACTEWESICKEALVAAGDPTPVKDMNVTDYIRLESILRVETVEVELLFWRPATTRLTPYRSWTTAKPPLAWYADYNQAKHNRNARFSVASFENVCLALAAVYALHERLHFVTTQSGDSERSQNGRSQRWYRDQIFSCIFLE